MSTEVFEMFESVDGKRQWRRHRKTGKITTRTLLRDGWDYWTPSGRVPEDAKPFGTHKEKAEPLDTLTGGVGGKEYTLPAELVAGIAAARGQLCDIYAARVREEDPIKADMASLIGELVEERYKPHQELNTLKEWRKELHEQCDKAKDCIDDVKNLIGKN